MRSRAKEGYLQIDHRASPGTAAVPGGMNFESATATCCHCGVPFPIKNRLKVNWCRRCYDYVCDDPTCRECKPYTAVLDREAEQIYKLIQARKI